MYEQLALPGCDDSDREYQQFVDKFKPKKTTDDCYTPPQVYDAVASYVRGHYHLGDARFVRPFCPGGDFEHYAYQPGDVVVDNPPFSIMKKILAFYQRQGIPFFLFAPALMIGTPYRCGCAFIACGVDVVYENGADVNTSFVTNLEPGVAARADPVLHDRVEKAVQGYKEGKVKKVGNYRYDGHVLTAAMMNYLAIHHTPFRVMREDTQFIRKLDAQSAAGKAIFGGGMLLSEKAAAEKAAAEKAAAEKAAAEKAAAEKAAVWELSGREKEIVRGLGRGTDTG